jgi:8-oxo-dGTP diphosphatase
MDQSEANPSIQPIFCSIDPVVFAIENDELLILLFRRPKDPYKDSWALPGGLIQPNQDPTLEESVSRVLMEKTGAEVNYVEQLHSFGGWRDVRGWTLSVAYIALVQKQELNSQAEWIPVSKLGEYHLAFDHHKIIEMALKRLTDKVNYSTLPVHFLGEKFTLPKLFKVYEVLLGEEIKDKSTLRYKLEASDTIEKTDEVIKEGPYRPATLYRSKVEGITHFSKNMLKK